MVLVWAADVDAAPTEPKSDIRDVFSPALVCAGFEEETTDETESRKRGIRNRNEGIKEGQRQKKANSSFDSD